MEISEGRCADISKDLAAAAVSARRKTIAAYTRFRGRLTAFRPFGTVLPQRPDFPEYATTAGFAEDARHTRCRNSILPGR